jgi:DNA-binding GntR family transcriptional regulator
MPRRLSRPPPKKKAIPARETAYQYLKSSILSGRFNAGDRLTEEHLAEELGVSRTPVREALHKLELEGLVKSLETRGFIVPRDSREEIEELFDMRAILKGYTLRLISQGISEVTLHRLDGLIQQADAALRRGRIDEVFKWNTQFHDTLQGLVRKKSRLHRLIVNMRKYVFRYRKDTLRYPDGGKRAIEGHRKIMLALRLKDPDLCERVMREHVQEAKEDALRATFGEAGAGVTPGKTSGR